MMGPGWTTTSSSLMIRFRQGHYDLPGMPKQAPGTHLHDIDTFTTHFKTHPPIGTTVDGRSAPVASSMVYWGKPSGGYEVAKKTTPQWQPITRLPLIAS